MPSLGVSSLDLAACGNASGLLFGLFSAAVMLICRLVAGACWHRPRGWSDSVPKAPDPGRGLKTPITAGLLNDRVVPFLDEKEVKLSRVLTGRGTGYCGNPGHHEYELYLAVEDTILGPRRRARKRIASLSASTRQCWTSSIASRSERGSMPRSRICRMASIYGSKATTRRDRIKAAGASARRRCKHSLTPSRLRVKK